MEEFHLVSSLCYKVERIPRLIWNYNYTVISMDGFPITMKDYKAFPGQMLKLAESRLQDVLLGVKFPDFDQEVTKCIASEDVSNWIKDDLRNEDPGYSFLSDRRNAFYKFSDHFLQTIMDEKDHQNVAHHFFIRGLDGQVHFKRGAQAFLTVPPCSHPGCRVSTRILHADG
jgi:hypothetical protein